MHTYLLRVWLPDRPGALGAVASRLGSVGADVLSIEILERGADRAIDELLLALPDTGRTQLLLAELAEVDGVAVEDLREVPGVRAERGVDLLELVAELSAEPDVAVGQQRLLRALVDRFDLDWIGVVNVAEATVVASGGEPPADDWLVGYALGAVANGSEVAAPTSDVAASRLDEGHLLLAGRARYELHERERRELQAVATIAGALTFVKVARDRC